MQDGTPLKFYSVGQDFFTGSHFDEYIYDFTLFKAGPVDSKLFEVPELCEDEEGVVIHNKERHHVSVQAVALLPGQHAEQKGNVKLKP